MKLINKIAGVTLLLFSILSCDINNSKKDLDSNVKISISGQQDNIKVVSKNAGQLFMSISSESRWKIRLEDRNMKVISWLSADNVSGEAVSGKHIVLSYTKNEGKERTALIILSNTIKSDTIEFIQQGISHSGDKGGSSSSGDKGGSGSSGDKGGSGSSGDKGDIDNPKPPVSSGEEHIHGDVTLIEAPELAGGSNNWYVSYRLRNNQINYSVEWNSDWKLPHWVCFTFDKSNEGKNTRRTNAWNIWDKITPSQMITQSWYPRGYDRGHMVASSDRLESRQANEQTFYYTNMTPQLSGLNQQFWNELEQWVQDLARSSFNPNIMYVVKGIAFDNGTPTKWVHNHEMAVPDYYYMAIVIKKNGKYHGIGLWVPHIEISRRAKDVSDVVTTIDEVEKRAGVDLFHNLPDDIERAVESENPRSGFWPGT